MKQEVKNARIDPEDVDIILEVVEENKPPSRLKEMLLYFALGNLGGIGLGLFIYYMRGA